MFELIVCDIVDVLSVIATRSDTDHAPQVTILNILGRIDTVQLKIRRKAAGLYLR